MLACHPPLQLLLRITVCCNAPPATRASGYNTLLPLYCTAVRFSRHTCLLPLYPSGQKEVGRAWWNCCRGGGGRRRRGTPSLPCTCPSPSPSHLLPLPPACPPHLYTSATSYTHLSSYTPTTSIHALCGTVVSKTPATRRARARAACPCLPCLSFLHRMHAPLHWRLPSPQL